MENRERRSSVTRVTGQHEDVPRGAERVLLGQEHIFREQNIPELAGREREKNAEENEIISIVNTVTNKILADLGLPEFNIPAKNVHVVPREKWWPEETGRAFYRQSWEAIVITANNRVMFAIDALHEMLHMKMYNSAQIMQAKEFGTSLRKSGLQYQSPDGSQTMFSVLNEALIEELVMQYLPEILKDSLFANDIEKTKLYLKHNGRNDNIAGKLGDRREIYYMELTRGIEKMDWVRNEKGERVRGGFLVGRHRYRVHRDILNRLINKLHEANIDTYPQRKEVVRLFQKGAFSSDMSPLWTLIDETFGNGAFTTIADLDDKPKELLEYVKSLKPTVRA